MTADLGELERLARAITLREWRLMTSGDDAKKIGPYVYAPSCGAVASVPLKSPMASDPAKYLSYIAAANPATILALISRLRAAEGALPDLSSVIAWLANGCATEHAVTELRIYQARIDAARAALPHTIGEGKP